MRLTEAYVPAYFISVFSGDINLVTTLCLPSEQQCALENVPNMKKIGSVLIYPGKIQGYMVNIKGSGYIRLLRQGRFQLKNVILYMYEVNRGTRIIQLRAKFVTTALRMSVIYACHVSNFTEKSGQERTLDRMLVKFWWPKTSGSWYGSVHIIVSPLNSSAHQKMYPI